MKHTEKDLRIVHSGMVQPHNEESAVAGSACELMNMRERETSLEVVGKPRKVSTLGAGDRVLLVDDDRILVLRGNNVMWNGNVVLDADAAVIDAHRVGELLVVVTSGGNVVLRRTASGYNRLNIATAIPNIHLAAVDVSSNSVMVPSYEFVTPYNTWQSPLESDDIDALNKIVLNSMRTLATNAISQGRYTGVMLARYGVRLWNDSYLWLSQPVMLGNELIHSSYRSTAEVYVSNGKYAGVDDFTLSMESYRLGISVANGVGSEWHDLVKSVDILVSPQASLVNYTSAIDYRCVVTTNTGTRRYLLEVGPRATTSEFIVQNVFSGQWQVVASTSQIEENGFVAVNTVASSQQQLPDVRTFVVNSQLLTADTVTHDQCRDVLINATQQPVGGVSMEHNGRLYHSPATVKIINPWDVLPWLGGDITAETTTAVMQVTLQTEKGEAVITKTQDCAFASTALNPVIAFPDPRATHIAIAVAGRKWECDLMPLGETGMSVYINPSLSDIVMVSGTITATSTNCVVVPVRGCVVVSAVANALVAQWRTVVSGCSINGMAAACRPIYSGGFGRYPIYLFTSRGIMALPQRTSGVFGEPRLISEQILANGAVPVTGDDGVWFVSKHGDLCFLYGSKLKVVARNIDITVQLAWNVSERELWIVEFNGKVKVLMTSGAMYGRNLLITSVYSDVSNALAVDAEGNLIDLTHEEAAWMQVDYLSQPFEVSPLMRTVVSRITWNLFTSLPQVAEHTGNVQLALRGERGSSCHGFVITQANVSGVVAAPLSRPVVSHPFRTLRLSVAGTLYSGTLLLPTHLRFRAFNYR